MGYINHDYVVDHTPGWKKTKARIYPSETATETKPAHVVIPPADVLAAAGSGQPDGKSPVAWMTESVHRFAAATGGQNERFAA